MSFSSNRFSKPNNIFQNITILVGIRFVQILSNFFKHRFIKLNILLGCLVCHNFLKRVVTIPYSYGSTSQCFTFGLSVYACFIYIILIINSYMYAKVIGIHTYVFSKELSRLKPKRCKIIVRKARSIQKKVHIYNIYRACFSSKILF